MRFKENLEFEGMFRLEKKLHSRHKINKIGENVCAYQQ